MIKRGVKKSFFILTGFIIASISMVCITVSAINAADGDAHLSAESVTIEKTDDRIILTLEGPVEIIYLGDVLTSESATVRLRENADSLIEAIETIELTGRITFAGTDGTRASASGATFHSNGRRLVLSGGVNFSQGSMSASANRIEYAIYARQVGLSGGCVLTETSIRAEASSAEYDLNTKFGKLSGNVIVRYQTSGILFGDEKIDEVIMRAESIQVDAVKREFRTPSDGERTRIQAGSFILTADSVTFRADSTDTLKEIRAEGGVEFTGPDIRVTTDRVTLSTSDRVLRAEGNVRFRVMGQSGSAVSLEVNFADRWSVRLFGANVSGEVGEIEDVFNGDD
ncbi:MAG TPA: hypothetical protein ENN67_05290 [Firmicutes bacterium]|nr:hypothetical protein [Bacillota bacterium]